MIFATAAVHTVRTAIYRRPRLRQEPVPPLRGQAQPAIRAYDRSGDHERGADVFGGEGVFVCVCVCVSVSVCLCVHALYLPYLTCTLAPDGGGGGRRPSESARLIDPATSTHPRSPRLSPTPLFHEIMPQVVLALVMFDETTAAVVKWL